MGFDYSHDDFINMRYLIDCLPRMWSFCACFWRKTPQKKPLSPLPEIWEGCFAPHAPSGGREMGHRLKTAIL